jgi:glutaredoxin-like protein
VTILKPSEQDYVRKVFKLLAEEVKISFFSQEPESHAGRETRQILEELAGMSDRVELRSYLFDEHKREAAALSIDKLPATVIEAKKDYGIRFFGIPAGYLVSSLIEDIVQVSKGVSELSEDSKEKLTQINSALNLQVFVSATSPYCPALVNIAHRMAIENDQISAHMIDIKEFPHLAMRYHVSDVPFTVVNNKISVEGPLDEKDYVDRVVQAFHRI